jgi:hypothetical protein
MVLSPSDNAAVAVAWVRERTGGTAGAAPMAESAGAAMNAAMAAAFAASTSAPSSEYVSCQDIVNF